MKKHETSDDEAKALGEKAEVHCMHDLLADAAEKYADSIALVCPHYPPDLYSLPNSPEEFASKANSKYLRWTYRHLQRVSHTVAAGLYQKGIRAGMTIAVFPTIGAEFQIILRAAWELGCTLTSIDPACISNQKEIQHMLSCTNPKAILVATSEFAQALDSNAAEQSQAATLKLVTSHTEKSYPKGWSAFQELFDFGQQHHKLSFTDVERRLNDEILIIFTSGTTSLPKGCVHTNASISVGSLVRSGIEEPGDSCVVSAHSPLFHAIGILLAIGFFPYGATVVHPAEKFSPGPVLKAIQDEKITHLTLVPAMISLLTEHPDFGTVDTSSIKKIQLGGSNVQPRHCQDCVEILKADKAHAAYGMSECWSPVFYPLDRVPDPSRSKVGNGFVMAGAMLKVCAPDSTTALKRGEAGELHLGGAALFKKYIGTESQPFYEDQDGRWFRTGDQAIMAQEGDIFIVGRYKELIIRGGKNIAPAAIENVLSLHEGLQSAVIGIQDDVAGEVPVAVIKGKNITQDDIDEIRRSTTDKLGSSYAPEMVINLQDLGIDDFPKTSSNKIRKVALQPMVQEYAKSREQSDNHADTDLEEKLCHIWRRILNHGKITPETRVTDFADSLVLSRARSQLRREMGLDMSLEEILENKTVEKQVRLLESRKGVAKDDHSYEDLCISRDGPPQAADMVHTHGCNDRERKTRDKCKAPLQPLGLDWDDVQEVYPMPDLMKIWAQSLRKQSANHRHAFITGSKDMEYVRTALEKVLCNYDILRCISVQTEPDTTLYAIIRASRKFFSHCITVFQESVKAANDLKRFVLDDEKYDFASPPGLLNRFILTRVEDTQQVALLFFGHHSCFDVLSSMPFYEDLDKTLTGSTESVAKHIPFKTWAELYYTNRTSLPAKLAIDFHVKRLSGVADSKQALFPRQRAAEWFKGHHFGWQPDPSIYPDKKMVEARLKQQTHIGVEGMATTVQASDLGLLKKDHGIEPAIVLKAALALVNILETGENEALFASYQAGREWPFLPSWMTKRLPPAMDIDGPTLSIAIERIPIPQSQTTLEFLQHLSREQESLTKYVHAPLLEIHKALSTPDAEATESIRRRQIFNWLPMASGFDEFEKLKNVQVWSRTDVGLLWNCTALGQNEVKVHASWDDAQLGKQEIEKLLQKFGGIAEVLSKEANWEKSLDEVTKQIVH